MNNIDFNLTYIVQKIENKKNEYYFIGFLVGIIPFILFMNFFGEIYKYTTFILGVIVALMSSLYLGRKSYRKMKQLFQEKYKIDYNEFIKSI